MNEILTRREKEVSTLVAAGLTDNQISGRLHISPATTRTHIQNIIVKLGVPNRTCAAVILLIEGHLSSEMVRQQIPNYND